MRGKVLVTGGAGYIGSHVCKALATAGFLPVAYDNLTTGHEDAVRWGPLVKADILDQAALHNSFQSHKPVGVLHFAAHAYVGESVEFPAKYYRNNVQGTMNLLDACRQANVSRMVFSSSCATYGVPEMLPITEETVQHPVNPYGRTKLIGEMMLQDEAASTALRFVALRYFNACGADPAGELSERHDPETHLIPRALMAAAGTGPTLDVFGTDYPTPDGTCIRDYVHVTDLADAHVQALELLLSSEENKIFNLGAGQGYSIFEVLKAIKQETGKSVPVNLVPRRLGDPPELYADISRARSLLGFAPRNSTLPTIIQTASKDFWFFQRH